MSSSTNGAIRIVEGVTAVDCQSQVCSWSTLLQSILWFLIPSCTRNDSNQQLERLRGDYYYNNNNNHYHHYQQQRRHLRRTLIRTNIYTKRTNNIMTGTIFGYRRGKVNFCIQSNPSSSLPILLLELATPTTVLAKEMKSGLLRIALEYSNTDLRHSSSLLSIPVWTMYCNGKKVGFAKKRVPTQVDNKVLRLMKSVVEDVGIINGKILMNSDDHNNNNTNDDDLMYFRANFERVAGSSNSESFHLINADGSNNQQLSIFFLRKQ